MLFSIWSWHVHWTRGKTLAVDLFRAPPGYIYPSFSSNKTTPPKKSLSQLKMLPFQPDCLKRGHYQHENSRVPLLRTVIMGCSGSKQKNGTPENWNNELENSFLQCSSRWGKVKLLFPPRDTRARARMFSPLLNCCLKENMENAVGPPGGIV